MRSKHRLLRIWPIILCLVMAVGCSSQDQAQNQNTAHSSESSSKPPIKLGVLIPKTGKGKDWGEKQEIAINIAAQEINEGGGINGSKLELIVLDTGGKNEEAVTMTRDLIKQGVVAIAGPYFSGEVEVAFPIANKAGVPIISSSSAKPGLTEKNRPWSFRNSMTSDMLLDAALPVFAKNTNVNKFAVIYDEKDAVSKSDGTKVFPAALEKHNFTIINKNEPITFKTGDIDFSSIVTKLKGMNPEAIAFGGLYQEAINFCKELQRQGLQVPVMGTVGVYSSALLEEGGSAVNGLVTPSYFNAFSEEPAIQSFVEKFKPEAAKLTPNNTLPDHTIATAYDTVQIIAKSMRDKGLDGASPLDELRTAIRDGWQGLKDYNGITGKFSINEQGDAMKQVYVLKIVDGQFREIKP